MRIRFKPWAREELETSPFYIDNPEAYKGKWKEAFDEEKDIHVELGCGKGSFIANLSKENQEINYIAVDLIDAMLGLAKRNVEVAYNIRETTNKEEIEDEIEKQKVVKNLKLTRYDIMRVENIFSKEDNIKRIYINFCNPWPKEKHHKRRLTHTRQLEQYMKFLNGEIYFKTDSDLLFEESLEYFKEAGMKIIKLTRDLEKEDNFWGDVNNIETEHEKMFKEEGIKIKALIAIKE